MTGETGGSGSGPGSGSGGERDGVTDGDENDAVTGGDENDAVTGGDENDAVTGGDENDAVTDGTRVLVVDDEAAVTDTFERALTDAGHEVTTARNGGEALSELQSGIDVVLLDRRMPGMSGDEVLAHIQEWRADCRVVLVTAVDPDVDVLELTFDDYLVKPVDPVELVETVDQLLLFDRYEALLGEYHAKTRKLATLEKIVDDPEDNPATESLADTRESVRADLEATIEAFSDDGIRDALLRVHDDLT